MTSRTEFIVEVEDPPDSTRSSRKIGFFARRRNRKKVRERTEELEEPIEQTESAEERVAKVRHPRRRGLTSPARPESNSPLKAAARSKSPDLVGKGPRRIDLEARRELREIPGRREFLRQSAVGAGILALGASLGYGSGYGQAQGLSGNTRTVITDNEIAARVIGGVRIATEFIPDPVPSGTDADPYPGSAIQTALNDGLHVYIPTGTWRLTSTIIRPADGATIIGAGKSTKLVLNGLSPCISPGAQSGWLIANLATDAGGIDLLSSSDSRITEIWVNGTLTDNRPRGTVSGGTGGHYGVRAADFITSGDGTRANPWNASAIFVDAVNALPQQGGRIFIKSGYWKATPDVPFTLGASGGPGRGKAILFEGEHGDISGKNYSHYNDQGWGTIVDAKVIVRTLGCNASFRNFTWVNTQGASDPHVKFLWVPSDGMLGPNEWSIGGTEIRNMKFMGGGRAIHFTSSGEDAGTAAQHWNVLIEHCHFRELQQAIQVDEGDGSTYNNIFRGNIKHIVVQAVQFDATKRTISIDIANLKGEYEDWLLEDCGGSDYAVYIRCARSEGFTLKDVDFGDNIRAPEGAYFQCYLSGSMRIRGFVFRKNVRLAGYVDAQLGRAAQFGDTGTINTSGESDIIIRKLPGLDFPIGTVSNPANVQLELRPGVIANQSGTERSKLGRGTTGNRGYVKLYDATLGAYRYLYIDNGSVVISASEPS